MIEDFCDSHHSYHAITPARAAAQRRVLRSFETFLDHPAEEATAEEFQRWLALLLQDRKASTVVAYAHMVTPFFEYAWQGGAISAEHLMRIKAVRMPRLPLSQPRPYSRKELTLFWENLREVYPDVEQRYWQRFNRGSSRWKRVWTEAARVQIEAIVALALDCGIRNREIYDASVDDIHYDNEYVIVRKGKGGKYREVPHSDASRSAVHRWLELRTDVMPSMRKEARRKGWFKCPEHDRPWLALDPKAAFKSSPLHPMSHERFGSLMQTIPPGYELHRFRHTCGTEWLRAGMEVQNVMRLLGHTDIKMTMRYAQLVSRDVATAVERVQGRFDRAVRPRGGAHA